MNIKKYRKLKGYTQQDMANFLGIHQSAYAHYENGRREPNILTLAKISIILGVSIDKLIEFYENYSYYSEGINWDKEKEPK